MNEKHALQYTKRHLCFMKLNFVRWLCIGTSLIQLKLLHIAYIHITNTYEDMMINFCFVRNSMYVFNSRSKSSQEIICNSLYVIVYAIHMHLLLVNDFDYFSRLLKKINKLPNVSTFARFCHILS